MTHDPVRSVTDQMGRQVHAPRHPSRIVSLVPSQTELLFDLGLDAEIAGVTKFCVHPAAKVAQKQSVGGTKKLRFDVIERLEPDLILGNKEENDREGILQLAQRYPVWMSDVITLDDACAMIRQVGELVNKRKKAHRLADQIESAFANLTPWAQSQRVGYCIWQAPFMMAGRNTFIDDMLARCGFVNAFAQRRDSRYPQVTPDQIRATGLDALLLASEPFPFAEKHRQTFFETFPGIAVYLVDGQMFSWYGSRLLLAAQYLRQLRASM